MTKRFSGVFIIFLFSHLIFCFSCWAQELPVFTAEEVVITASGREESLEKSLSSVIVLKAEELKKQGFNYLSEALGSLSGADLKTSGLLGSLETLSLRGSRSEQVLVLLDGQRLNSSQNGVFDFSGIALDNLERIEIVKTPLSALYGADALGGVIHLISKKPQKKKIQLSFLAGGFGQKKYQFGYEEQINKIGYGLNYDFVDSSGFRPNSDFHGKNLSFNMNLPENFLGAGFRYRYKNNDLGVPGSLVYPNSTARQNDENHLFSLEANFPELFNFKNTFHFSYNNAAQKYTDILWQAAPSFHKNRNLNFDWTASGEVFEKQILTGGFSYLKNSITSSDVGEHLRNALALYGQDEWPLTSQWGIFAGGRLERFSIFGKVFSPRFGFKYQVNDQTTLKTSWSRGFRTPTFNELYWPQSSWAGGNPNLKPEEGEMYDLEISSRPGWGIWKISGFLGKTFNLINWAADNHYVWRPQNLAQVDRRGAEASVELPLLEWLKIVANFSWQNVTEITSGREVTYTPHYKFNAGLNLKNPADSLGANLNFGYTGWRYAENNEYSARTLPAYLITNLNGYFKSGNWTLRLGLENLFDIQYEEIADYPAPGRNAWVSIGVEF